MCKLHNFSLEEVNCMIPFEKEIYATLIKQYIDEEKKQFDEMKRKHSIK